MDYHDYQASLTNENSQDRTCNRSRKDQRRPFVPPPLDLSWEVAQLAQMGHSNPSNTAWVDEQLDAPGFAGASTYQMPVDLVAHPPSLGMNTYTDFPSDMDDTVHSDSQMFETESHPTEYQHEMNQIQPFFNEINDRSTDTQAFDSPNSFGSMGRLAPFPISSNDDGLNNQSQFLHPAGAVVPRRHETVHERDFFNFTEESTRFFQTNRSRNVYLISIPERLEAQRRERARTHTITTTGARRSDEVVCHMTVKDTKEIFKLIPENFSEWWNRYSETLHANLDEEYEYEIDTKGRRNNMSPGTRLNTVPLTVERASMRAGEYALLLSLRDKYEGLKGKDQTKHQTKEVSLTISEAAEKIPSETLIRGTRETIKPWLNRTFGAYTCREKKDSKHRKAGQYPRPTGYYTPSLNRS
ncbi:hypothetical protein I302_107114 [Kwoniella bestiolae CBS 10118]|uniref:Uncharacterized protein n=1 Tax=Kwoniella bestiolae CBS 10118 TaxID=1296100 RepID=A0A1B9FZG7_9TREE|nr:hypothetical protein I302_05621 [Kwoniella bestiolae CBS 10118]OCF24162.1 hypothetical protein I302_05621 [Kwoniella bestiolae CBS 10118]